jgi:endoplasmic reticulum-Golgi intermediate compartment protein 3
MSLRRLKALDAFPKIQDDFYSKTLSGGIITIICSVFMAGLFLSELAAFLSRQEIHRLEVDTSRGETINVTVCQQK